MTDDDVVADARQLLAAEADATRMSQPQSMGSQRGR